jgi:bifunctional DNA-binding transcriptional regulator/antitoxin component of YhaV-PrlF toxin-antitoxin module
MNPDIVIVREGDGYRLLHGHLRLATELGRTGEVDVEVRGEGRITIVRVQDELQVRREGQEGRQLPLYRH